MSKPLAITSAEIGYQMKQGLYLPLSERLQNAFKIERNPDGTPKRFEFSEDVIEGLHGVLKSIVQLEFDDSLKALSKELFRALRNYVITPETRNCLANNLDFLDNIKLLLSQDCCAEVVQIVLQFLINLVISSEDACHNVFNVLAREIVQILKRQTCIHESSALLYNISLFQSLAGLDVELYTLVFDLLDSEEYDEYLDFLFDKFLEYDNFWEAYPALELKQRIVTLETIRGKQIGGYSLNFPEKAVITLAKQFASSGSVIFQTVASNDDDLKPQEVSLLLEVLSSLCSNEKYLEILQTDKDLLINSGVLLINIHQLGKQSTNYFSSVQKLSELRDPNGAMKQHPAFGFKVGLIRMIGNMCWKSEMMQDLVREAELIPVILDCCNMDARNPFIMQWVILAIRNLCENNRKNQEFIAGLHQEGVVSSAVLAEMGLTLDSDGDNSIKLVPLDALRRQ